MKYHNWINTGLILVVVGFLMLVGNNQPVVFSGTTAGVYNVTGSGHYQVDGATVIDANGNVDATITTDTIDTTGTGTFGGDVTITTTNTATSSMEVGCWDTYATSTDTAVRISATTTPGLIYSTFGACSTL